MLAFLRSLGERASDLLFGLAASLGLVLGNNNLLTISFITNEALMVLENELTFTSQVNRVFRGRWPRPLHSALRPTHFCAICGRQPERSRLFWMLGVDDELGVSLPGAKQFLDEAVVVDRLT